MNPSGTNLIPAGREIDVNYVRLPTLIYVTNSDSENSDKKKEIKKWRLRRKGDRGDSGCQNGDSRSSATNQDGNRVQNDNEKIDYQSTERLHSFSQGNIF